MNAAEIVPLLQAHPTDAAAMAALARIAKKLPRGGLTGQETYRIADSFTSSTAKTPAAVILASRTALDAEGFGLLLRLTADPKEQGGITRAYQSQLEPRHSWFGCGVWCCVFGAGPRPAAPTGPGEQTGNPFNEPAPPYTGETKA